MNSFTKKLVLNCTGVIFVSFLVVYFLFNFMVGRYIRSIAEQELSDGVPAAISMVSFIPHDMRRFEITVMEAAHPFTYSVTAHVPVPADTNMSGQVRFGWHTGDLSYAGWYPANMQIPAIRSPRPLQPFLHNPEPFRVVTGDFIMPMDMDLIYWHIDETDILRRAGYYEIARHPYIVMTQLARGQLTLSQVGSPRLIDTNMIMINANNEIISPALQTLTPQGRTQVEFLVRHYLTNQARFAANGMTMVTGANSAYYVRAINQPMQDGLGPVSILLYADISSAAAFQRSMNRILGALLVFSGLLSLVISVAMSARFKRAIGRLCNYADAIGRGDRDQKAGTFRDAEFNRLSKSMDNMSYKLQAYENNQKQFFQNVSHELRTPLMSIQGYAEGILSDVFDKEEAAGVILSEGRKMADLVGELLYVSKIDSTQTTENIINIDVPTLLCECVERLKPIAQKSGKTISIDSIFESIENTTIDADEEKFARAILNILSNAIRHAKNEVKIVCGVADGRIKIVIRDDGDGINPDDLPNIFERFYKGENGNYGLGLAISNDIVKNMGGIITAKNLEFPETGARFEMSFPLAQV